MDNGKYTGKKLLMIHNGGKSQGLLYEHVCEQLGMKFFQISDKPNEKALGKIAGRLHLRFYEQTLFRHYSRELDKIAEEFDYIIVIRGEYTPIKAIKLLRDKNPKAKMILYMWDSIENCRGIEKKWDLFDKVFTFDRADYLKNKDRIGFVPLFYCEEYINKLDDKCDRIYDLAFIGTAHGDRPKIVKALCSECQKRGMNMYVYLYSPHLLVYYYNKLFNKDYKGISKKDLVFKPLPQSKIYELYCKSKCVLDVEIKTQTGLTMRTMDILGLKRKMITTNRDIVNYDFYNENNLFILDRNSLNMDYGFLTLPYQELDEKIYSKYSMKSWLINLLG